MRTIQTALPAALLLAGVCALSANAGPTGTGPVATVAHVDLDRYMGRWYEILKIPNRFQKQCSLGASAEYIREQGGRIAVINRCTNRKGEPEEARGVGEVVDPASNARLRVSFVSFLGWRPFWGDYWIIGLDQEYRWAVVGTPDRKYGWVLARTPEIDERTLEEIHLILEGNGYDPSSFVTSPQ